jgi:hypothetical protein
MSEHVTPIQPSPTLARREPLLRRIAAGAAIVGVPVAGMLLYLKSQQQTALGDDRGVGDQSEEDLARLSRVDPSLIRFHQTGRMDVGAGARAMTVDKVGNVIVAGTSVAHTIGASATHEIRFAGAANCVAAADDGRLYIGFRDHVEVFAAGGQKQANWPALPSGAYLTGIAISGDSVYLADSGRRVVVRTDRSGRILNEIGRADASRGIPGLLLPSPHLGVAVADDGTIWVNNAGRYQLENYTPDGNLERFWGAFGTDVEGFIGCCNPTDFALLKDGSFITAEKGIARVKHYLADGRFDSVVAAPASFGQNMTGLEIVVDLQGRVLVLERGTSIVHIFAANGGAP